MLRLTRGIPNRPHTGQEPAERRVCDGVSCVYGDSGLAMGLELSWPRSVGRVEARGWSAHSVSYTGPRAEMSGAERSVRRET